MGVLSRMTVIVDFEDDSGCAFENDSYLSLSLYAWFRIHFVIVYILFVFYLFLLVRKHIFNYTWYVWLKIWGEVSKFTFVISPMRPSGMLNPPLLFLEACTEYIRQLSLYFTMIGLKEHPYIYYNQILKNKEKRIKKWKE